jgi:hypothetical protein
MADFSASAYAWKSDIDYRLHPELYRIGKGEQGVLLCQPYKSEILPYWRFKTPEQAQQSANSIYELFLAYLAADEFVGADLARKYLQMGFTRARRYTNYKGGRKYAAKTGVALTKGTGDPLKAQSAAIFYQKWQQAENHEIYKSQKAAWKKNLG